MKKRINCNTKSSTSKILTSRKKNYQPKMNKISPILYQLNFKKHQLIKLQVRMYKMKKEFKEII